MGSIVVMESHWFESHWWSSVETMCCSDKLFLSKGTFPSSSKDNKNAIAQFCGLMIFVVYFTYFMANRWALAQEKKKIITNTLLRCLQEKINSKSIPPLHRLIFWTTIGYRKFHMQSWLNKHFKDIFIFYQFFWI